MNRTGTKERGRSVDEWRRRSAAVAIVACILLGACAPRATGPAFRNAVPPAEDRARLYLYRVDPRPSISPVRVRIDGRPVGVLHNGEYETVLLAPGSHRIEAGVRSVAFVAWGWNDQRLHIEPGETAYLRLAVRVDEREPPPARALEIAGRPSGAASENVFLQPRGEAAALQDLAGTTRVVPESKGAGRD